MSDHDATIAKLQRLRFNLAAEAANEADRTRQMTLKAACERIDAAITQARTDRRNAGRILTRITAEMFAVTRLYMEAAQCNTKTS